MSNDLQVNQWALKVGNDAIKNETVPYVFWTKLREELKSGIEALNRVFNSEQVESILWESENSVRIKYRNTILGISIDFRTGKLQFSIRTFQAITELMLMDELYSGFVKLKLQIGSSSIIKAEDASIPGLSALLPQSLHYWTLPSRLSQFLLQKLVAPELDDAEFTSS